MLKTWRSWYGYKEKEDVPEPPTDYGWVTEWEEQDKS
jgi:hypothetical protein